jgi:ABC-type branched-subunit amino acid transport system substrate-binding protein
MYRRAISASALAALVLGVGGGLSSASAAKVATTASKGPYNIAMVAGITGADSANAISGVAGAKAAMNYINHHGGVNGHPINMTVYNDQSSPTVSPAVAQQAVSSHPVAVLDTTASTEFTARQPVYEAAKIPVITDTSSDVYYPWMYNAITTAYQEAQTYVTGAETALGVKNLKGKKLAYVAADTTGDHAQYPFIQQLIAKAGGKIVDTEYQPLGSPTFNGAPNVVSAHPNLVMIGDSGPDGIVETNALHNVGYNGLIYSNYGASATTVLTTLNTPKYSAQWLAPEVLAKSSLAYQWAQKDNAVADIANSRYATFWSSMMLYSQGLSACGYPCSPAKLEASLKKLGRVAIPGGSSYGTFGVAGTNHVLMSSYELASYKNGKFVQSASILLGPPHYTSGG